MFNNQDKKLIGIKFPSDKLIGITRTAARDTVFMKAPFKSEDVFLGRTRARGSLTENSQIENSMLVAGGGTTLISFNLEEK